MKTWRDTIAETEIAATHEEADAGWPERMFVWRIAQLQRPSAPKPLQVALHYDLADAANAGTVPSIEKPMLLQFSGKRRDVHGNTYDEPREAPRTKWVHEKFVAAGDVVAWLRGRGEGPSEYIMAWLAATSPAACQQAAAPEPAAAGTAKKWTPERLQELAGYRKKHGTAKAAAHFEISAARVRELLPSERKAPAGHAGVSVFTHRIK